MIASHRHKTIFVKTRKTAGTSVEIAFSSVCGDRDVITPLGEADEELRRESGGRGPQHYRRRESGLRARLRGTASGARNHMPAAEVISLLGRRVWDEYRTFAVERNPWDRAVSLYYFRSRQDAHPPPFGEFLRSMPADRLSNFDLYAVDGTVAVDQILRFEDLDAELARLWSALGVSPPTLGRAKAGFRPAPTRDYRELYTDDDAQLVASVCHREIDLLGYRFGPGPDARGASGDGPETGVGA